MELMSDDKEGTPVTRVTRARRDQGSDTRDELENCPPNARKTPEEAGESGGCGARGRCFAVQGLQDPSNRARVPLDNRSRGRKIAFNGLLAQQEAKMLGAFAVPC
jgi:hypothetical protein